jgi:hypothetical protein
LSFLCPDVQLETGEEPTEGELFLGDSRSKYYWINREVFILEKGVLWKEGDEGKTARRVVPKMYREQIVKLCHDPPLPPPDHPG